MIDVDYIKQQLLQKMKDNTKNGKTYHLDLENKRLIKIRPNLKCNLELDVMRYLCHEYYRLGIDIQYNITDEYVTISTPFLDCLHEDTYYTKDQIIKNTSIFLQDFTTTNYFYKDLLIDEDNLHIETYQDNWDPRNYFLWKNQIYLLDLESFYFCIKTKDGQSVGRYGIQEDRQTSIQAFRMPADIRYALKDDDTEMLVY